jgi:hypothetical protein
MPNINLYDIYNRKRNKFGILDSTNFQDYFVDSVNLVYSEYNEKVFEASALEPIGSFDDIIDTRLAKFTDITFDATSDLAIGDRQFWSIEWDLERTSAINGITDTITDGSGPITLKVLNNIFSIVSSVITASATIPEADLYTIKFESNSKGTQLFVNGDEVGMTYTGGDAETAQPIAVVASHVIDGASGFELLKTRFLTAGTLVYSFDINEETVATNLTDDVASYIGTLTGQQWDTRYIEPSTSLDFRYRSSFEMGLDYHIQDGGQFGLEPESERERKWYGRGIRSAREVYSQQTPYISPLNIQGD